MFHKFIYQNSTLSLLSSSPLSWLRPLLCQFGVRLPFISSAILVCWGEEGGLNTGNNTLFTLSMHVLSSYSLSLSLGSGLQKVRKKERKVARKKQCTGRQRNVSYSREKMRNWECNNCVSPQWKISLLTTMESKNIRRNVMF